MRTKLPPLVMIVKESGHLIFPSIWIKHLLWHLPTNKGNLPWYALYITIQTISDVSILMYKPTCTCSMHCWLAVYLQAMTSIKCVLNVKKRQNGLRKCWMSFFGVRRKEQWLNPQSKYPLSKLSPKSQTERILHLKNVQAFKKSSATLSLVRQIYGS